MKIPFGDRERIFLLFYETYKRQFYRYALSLLQNPALAEEAVQEAWSRCVQHADTFLDLPPEKRPAWMTVVVRNAARTLHSKERRYVPLEQEERFPAPDPGDASGIAALIESLPETYRQVLRLKFLLEWTDREIARGLALSETAVRTRVWRGRKLLQDALRKEGYWYDP